jgi:hypothetical protein
MATTTTRLGLTKPDYADNVDIADINSNMDDIDAAVGASVVTSGTRPASPFTGQVIYETDTESTFVWTGSAWIASGGGASVTVSETAPVSPAEGDLWLNSTEAKMYVYYDDGTSAQWVAAVGGTVPSQGKIIAVKDALFTGTQSASVAGGDNVAVTDLSITHEVADASNKLIISAFLGAASNNVGFGNVGLAVHDGTGLIAVGASPGSRAAVTAGGATVGTGSETIATMPSVTFVHTPGAGSKTYTVRAININTATDTVHINRAESDTDVGTRFRAVSSLVIQEVSV